MNKITKNSSPTIIIGAGPAGLTAGYELAKFGKNAVILEADKTVGGISRTVNYQGYRFDIGGHRFFSKVPYINELWNEIMPDDFLLRPRLSRIHYKGHFFDYPLKITNALQGLGLAEALLVCFSYSKAKLLPNSTEDNFEQWIVNRFGRRLYRIFFKTYTEKVWGMPCHAISADWAAQRIKNLSLREALTNAIFPNGKDRSGAVVTSLIEQFHYPRLGPGMMWQCCKDALTEKRSPTIYGERVDRIRHTNGRVDCVYSRNQARQETQYEGPHYVSTMSLKELIWGLDPPPPDEVVQAAKNLRYRDYLMVVLIVGREQVFPDNWIYVHTPEVKLGRVQNYKNWSPDMVPDSSKTALGLEYFLWEQDEEWRWPDERLIATGIRECAQIGLIQPGDVEDGTVVRMKNAYPVYDLNYHTSLEIIRQYLAGFSNLQTVGRNGLHRYNNQDHSMMTGVYAARNIMGESHDLWSVNTEKEYHENGTLQSAVNSGGDRLVPVGRYADGSPSATSTAESADAIGQQKIIEEAFAMLDPLAFGFAVGVVCGFGLFLAGIVLLVRGGGTVGPTLSLLGHFLPGFAASWPGIIIGLVEAGAGGFVLGNMAARLRNWLMFAYSNVLRHRAEAEENPDILDKI